MDHHSSEHLNSIIGSINWAWFLAALGMTVGWIAWAMQQVFSTRKHTEKCRADMMQIMAQQKDDVLDELQAHEQREEKKMDEHRQHNTAEHSEIRADLRWIRDHLYKKNGGAK